MLSLPEFRETLARHYVKAELYTDKGRFAAKNEELLDKRFKGDGLPLYLVLGPDGQERARLAPDLPLTPEDFAAFLEQGLEEPAPKKP